MPVLTKHRFTTEDYHRMTETGVFRPDDRVELLDGEIFDMSPIGPSHGSVTKRLNQCFHQLAQGRWIVSIRDPVHLETYSEPQPDLMLLKVTPDFYRLRYPLPADVFLLVEIAEASIEYDRQKKLPAYGRAGIREYWIVNLEEKAVEVYREPHLTGYRSRLILHSGDKAHPLAFPDALVDVAELMKHL